ncbi:putative sensor domain DACNV-containing protein [Chitinophaga lutea]
MEWTNTAAYPAAQIVAGDINTHFTRHLVQAREEGETELATAPTEAHVQSMIDVAFWASLRREEGMPPRISLAYLQPSETSKPLLFGHRIPLSPKALTKLAPGVDRPGVHIGIWHDREGLYIWGTTIKLPNYCFVLDVSEPGLLVVKHRRPAGLGKFTNVAMLQGDQVKVVDESCGRSCDCPPILTTLLGMNASPVWNHPVNVLIQIAVSMRAHKRGGILLVVPADSDAWRESIIQPMQYPVSPAFSGVADLIRKDGNIVSEIYWQNALRREVDNITGLTAVDGATIINDRHELLAFGAKITRSFSGSSVEQVLFTEPVVGGDPAMLHPSRIGGTRHLSAAQFVYDQPGALALVASQDGYFTVFSWSPQRKLVMAHRIDILLI